jgi:hypothetical protein
MTQHGSRVRPQELEHNLLAFGLCDTRKALGE